MFYGNVMDFLFDVVCIVDVEGCYFYVSVVFEFIFGYMLEEVVGRFMIELVYFEDCECMLEVVSGIMGGNVEWYFENCYICKDGCIVYIMWLVCWLESD